MRMKRLTFLLSLALLLVSCGSRSGQFKLEGRFLHLNQGELYVYSPDGAIQGFDTIKVEAGRFAYQIPCEDAGTLVLVFPNFSEQPIFAESGGSVEVSADASHLKEMKVKGTDDNELMTQFREQIVQASPPEELRLATQFIKDHPASPVSTYLLRKYYLRSTTADCAEGAKLAALLLKEQPKNGLVVNMKQQLEQRARTANGQRLPSFTATDVNGQQVSDSQLRDAPLAFICVWATWNFQSLDQVRKIERTIADGANIKLLGICVDARTADCKNALFGSDIQSPMVCDGLMLESPLLAKLGLASVPSCLVLNKGKIVGRNLSNSELQEKLNAYKKQGGAQ